MNNSEDFFIMVAFKRIAINFIILYFHFMLIFIRKFMILEIKNTVY